MSRRHRVADIIMSFMIRMSDITADRWSQVAESIAPRNQSSYLSWNFYSLF